MDIKVFGFDQEKLDWFKNRCSALQWNIAQTQNPDEATIVMSDQFFDPHAYNAFLKANKNKRYLIYPGVDTAILENIIAKLSGSLPPVPSFMPPELINRYSDSFYEKIILLDKLAGVSSINDFKDEVHKIAGSAGSFGYPEMTLLSRKLEPILISIVENQNAMTPDEIHQIEYEYQNSLKLAFQNIYRL